jgi:hypothetical protein
MATRLDFRARARALVRLTAYVAVVGLGLGAFGLHAAKAEAGKAGLALGRQLLPLVELESERSTIRINGQSLFVSSAIVDGTVGGILDRFEHECREGNASAKDAWPTVARTGVAARSFAPRLEVFRREGPNEREGVVFCFAAHGRDRAFADAARRYRETHDLGAFGALRYAFVTRTDEQRVRVVATWTEGSFRLDARAPSGDAEGADPEAAPRPPRSKRLMSATLGEAPYGMYAFSSADSPEAVLHFYDDALSRAHWVAITPPASLSPTAPSRAGLEHARSYVKDGVQLLVAATPDRQQGTLVSIGELGAQSAQR